MNRGDRLPRGIRPAHSIGGRAGVAWRRQLRVPAGVLMATGALFLIFTVGASAATVNGTATIETSSDTAMTYPAGSTTPFTVTLPSGAACSGDTATDGYHVYTYMVTQGTGIAALTFIGHPSAGYGIYNNSNTYQGPFNTAPSTGVVQTLSVNLEWGPAVVAGKIPLATLLANGGVWEVGVACANSTGALTDNWNIEITFSASGSDPDGFVWSAVPGPPSTTTSSSSSSTTSSTAPTSSSSSTSTTSSTAPTSSSSTTSTTAALNTNASSTTSTTSTTGSTAPTGTSSTTSTTAAANGSSGPTGSAGSSGTGTSGSGTSAGSTSSTGGSLPFTGMPASMARIVGAGLLGIGLGLMLLASGYRRIRALRMLRLSRSAER